MISAFGIDHGDSVSKGRLTAAQKATRGVGKGGPTRPARVKAALNRAGEADISIKGIGDSTGRTINRTGGFMQRHPGLTGTALVGGAGAGGTYYLATREPKKKRT